MKRVLSTGDIGAVFGNADDQCDHNNNALYTQVRTRQHRKKASTRVVSTQQSVTVSGVVSCPGKSVQSTADAVATVSGVSDHNTGVIDTADQSVLNLNNSSDEVMHLKAEIINLKQTVNQLSNQLEFVLSYLGLVNGGAAGAGGNGLLNSAQFPPLSGSGPLTVSASAASVVYTATSTATVHHFPAASANTHQGARSFHDAAAAAAYADKAENDRPATSFINRGMSTSNSSSDRDLVARLCTEEFGQCPDIALTKRLGRQLPDKVQPLLVYLKRTDQAKNTGLSSASAVS